MNFLSRILSNLATRILLLNKQRNNKMKKIVNRIVASLNFLHSDTFVQLNFVFNAITYQRQSIYLANKSF